MTRDSANRVSAAAAGSARGLFLRDDNLYGCAEATLVALQRCYGRDDADRSGVAMALNGGVAYSGGVCGAISGAAMAVGRLAEDRIADHAEAKRTARRLIQSLIDAFESEFGGRNCSDLIDYEISIPAQHDAFIESGVWRDTCMRQIEFSVARLGVLADRTAWDEAVRDLGA